MLMSVLFVIDKNWKQFEMFIIRQMDKQLYIYKKVQVNNEKGIYTKGIYIKYDTMYGSIYSSK